jgi:hypothetical protein
MSRDATFANRHTDSAYKGSASQERYVEIWPIDLNITEILARLYY